MNSLGVLIADGSGVFCEILAETLGGSFRVCTSQNGSETLELVRTFRPDVLVLDLMLPGLDGISLLQQIAAAENGPKILATTRFVSDYLADTMEALGVGYVMRKPCDMRALAARIADLSRYLRGSSSLQPDLRTVVSNLLLSLNVPTKLRGYGYLREAILIMSRDPGQSITKELYPAVAARCGGNAVQVERSVRSAIQAAWNSRDEQIWRRYFSACGNQPIQKPTNASFISRLADQLSFDRSDVKDPAEGAADICG